MKDLRSWIIWIGIIAGALYFISSCQNKSVKDKEEEVEPDTVAILPPVIRYGLAVDSFEVYSATVKPNQHLGLILGGFNVDMSTIDQLARNSSKVFDARKIRSGNPYSVFFSNDSLRQPLYFVYENNATEYVVYELFDTLKVYRGEKDIETITRVAYGTIGSSLWNTMRDHNLDPMLALDLSDIFAWTIDFYAIQKGDRFRVIYDELLVDSVSIGIGTIHAVQFDHAGSENYAFRFFQDERFDYFDNKGLSLRKSFLKSPLEFARISSHFSNSRMHPVLRIRRPHHGVDYAAPKGTPVKSIGDGTVIARAYQKNGGGNYIKIKHNSEYTTTYMHLAGFGKGVVQGARVKQGQVIGFVGATGLATGPHLDFRVHRNGKPIDPLKVEAPPVEPVREKNVPAFSHMRDSLMDELHNINWDRELVSIH